MELIVLAGMPATGKSTVAAGLAAALGYPVMEKDSIKETLFDTLGFSCYAQKRRLDIAANGVLLQMLELMLGAENSVIVVNNFDTASAARLRELIETHRPSCVTLFLRGDAQVLYERYVQRDRLHLRHLGHIVQEHYPPREGDPRDHTMTRQEFDERFFTRGMDDFSCPGPRIELDMTDFAALDLDALVEQIQALLKQR